MANGFDQQNLGQRLQDTAIKEIEKNVKQQVSNRLQQGQNPQNILSALMQSVPSQQQNIPQQQFMPQQQTKQQNVISQLLGAVGIDPSQGLIRQGGFDPQTGEAIIPTALFGLIRPPAAEQAQLQQAAEIRQRTRGEQRLQIGELQALGIETQQRQLSEALKREAEGKLKPNEIFTKFRKAAEPFEEQRASYGRIIASAQDPSPAGDLALIFNYMKVLDPGSVVREGEFANAQNSAGVPGRIRSLYNRIIKGTRLNESQRADFVDRANRIFEAARQNQELIIQEFSNLAQRNQIDPRRILIEGTQVAQQVQQKPQQQSKKRQEENRNIMTTPSGIQFRIIE